VALAPKSNNDTNNNNNNNLKKKKKNLIYFISNASPGNYCCSCPTSVYRHRGLSALKALQNRPGSQFDQQPETVKEVFVKKTFFLNLPSSA
jgi:hypothetical protein